MDQQVISQPINVLGISGSLREGSFNTALLKAMRDLAPAETSVDIATLHSIPFYNEDVKQRAVPQAVADLCGAIERADAVVISTPEYNYSIPGVLKNAIDWISRAGTRCLNLKPLAIIGASPGRMGTVRAQYHLRQCLIFLNPIVLNKPEVFVGNAAAVFGEGGAVGDEPTKTVLRQLHDAIYVVVNERRKICV